MAFHVHAWHASATAQIAKEVHKQSSLWSQNSKLAKEGTGI